MAPVVGSSASFNFNVILTPGSSVTFSVEADFTASAGAGTYQFSLTGAAGTNGQTVQFSGLPVAGASVTIAIAMVTPTMTSTSASPTVQVTSVIVSPPYPNPADADQTVMVNIQAPGTATVSWSVFTTAFRMIDNGATVINGSGSVQWDLRDKSGSEVAPGLYYLRIEVKGSFGTIRRIAKILVTS